MQRAVKELADAVGLAGAIEIVRRWGGRDLNVPTQPPAAGDPLALTLGLETAQRLVRAFAGRRLQLPAERNALLDLRNAAIARAVEAGQSHEAVGLEFGLTRQGVAAVLRKVQARPQLFAGAAEAITRAE